MRPNKEKFMRPKGVNCIGIFHRPVGHYVNNCYGWTLKWYLNYFKTMFTLLVLKPKAYNKLNVLSILNS